MAEKTAAFKELVLEAGVTLHHRQTKRFKSELLRVFVRAPIDHLGAHRRLFASMTTRGILGYPTRRALSAHLDDLFGAGFGLSAQRLIGRQILAFRASTVSGQFLPGKPDNFAALVDFVGAAFKGPALENGQLQKEFLEQERRTLLRALHARLNDKGRLAMDRMRALLHDGTPFADPPLGLEKDIQGASADDVLAAGLNTLKSGEMDIYVCSPLTLSKVEKVLRAHLPMTPRKRTQGLKGDVRPPRRRLRSVSETSDIAQAKLVMAFRLEGWKGSEAAAPCTLGDVVFGGGATSRLFRNVREAQSLCYDVSSSLIRRHGTWIVTAGVDPSNTEAAVASIRAEMKKFAKRPATDEEIETARRQVLSSVEGVVDSPSGMVEFWYKQRLLGERHKSLEQVGNAYVKVKQKQIADIAARAKLDTVFILDAEENTAHVAS